MKTSAVTTSLVLIGAPQLATATIGSAGKAGQLFVEAGMEMISYIFGECDNINPCNNGRDLEILEGVRIAKRQNPFPGVPDFEYQRCEDDIVTREIVIRGNQQNVRFENVPPTCMNLANVLVGDPASGPWALPCGSACLEYANLTPAQFQELEDIFFSL